MAEKLQQAQLAELRIEIQRIREAFKKSGYDIDKLLDSIDTEYPDAKTKTKS